jgi:hypothetical protein
VVISSNFELFGVVKARWMELSSNAKIHFDEKLANGGLEPGAGYTILGWRPLDGALAASGDGP